MSGHSKWAGIKHKKAIVDAKRGQVFTKIARELSVSVREGGPDPSSNFRLRLAIQKAREVNMPADNIDRAIQRGVGGKDGAQLEEIRYEGYGPHGVAVMVDVLTDNRNRTVAAIRNLFTRSGGSLGETNSVGWMFSQQGVLRVAAAGRDPDELALELLEVVDLGADGDITVADDAVVVTVSPAQFEAARTALEGTGHTVESGELTMDPSTSVSLDAKQATAVIRLLENLEEDDDVQQVYANAEIPDEILESVG
ncbi:MAG: YebC/PmpR family DNA-binding transcriptional regulator [Candidatus Dormibacteraeota bacterium]|uniref:Probable transcriptional regulatory protein JF887_12195 n=1 Tax=Candidatus Amunia macphersoniae TaxID=3127014 RepID=A0A934KPJ8_9BACT|nr:YebC/PmpR family DNA-binding transcriptional regulator [Candidatus Dormibacteraeota bacterium]